METELFPADGTERRAVTKRNSEESHEGVTQRAQTSLTGLQGVRETANTANRLTQGRSRMR